MKKNILMIAIFGCIFLAGTTNSQATIHNVEVEDFEFNPSTFIANVGDTVHWFWHDGFHTTTSTLIPATALTWDQSISNNTPTFDYVITVAGSYDYICIPHASMGMSGHFTAVNPTSIEENTAPSLSLIKNYISDGQIHIDYSMPVTSSLFIEIFDVLGHQVYAEEINNQPVGIHSHRIDIGSLPNGIYILSLFAQKSRLTHKLVIEN